MGYGFQRVDAPRCGIKNTDVPIGVDLSRSAELQATLPLFFYCRLP
jgi:hypothetical protein